LSTTANLYFTFPGIGLQRPLAVTIRFVEMKPNGTGVMAATFPDGSIHSVLYAISEAGTKFSFVTRDVNGLPPGGTLGYVISGVAVRQQSPQLQPGTYAGTLRNANMALIGVVTVLPDGSTRVSRKIFTGGFGIISDLDTILCTVTAKNADGTGIFGCQVDGRIDSVFFSFGDKELFFTLVDVAGIPVPNFVLSGSFTRQ
jgi:hypothetical protein